MDKSLIKNKDFLKNISVLYVEDNKDIAEEISFILSNIFPNFYFAENGAIGLEKFKEYKPEIVLTDIQMPVMDGITMSRHIKEIEENTHIIISSAFNESKYLMDAIDLGVDNYIIKPTSIKKLISIFENILKILHNERELKNKLIEISIEKDIAIQASKVKSQFLANMSHEIRTPLNAILGFIYLLQENEEDPEKIKYLNVISTSSNNLLEIINDILDFSKIESNKLELEYIDFNTKDAFDFIAELFKAKAKEKEIKLIVEISKNMPSQLNSDILKIKQVIINLLSNAIKFTDSKKRVILNISYENKCLLVSVKDEGIGIQKDKLETVFESFKQADSSTTRKYGGTGLGLAIGYKIVEALGGALKVNSEVGIGSEFYFSIPVAEVLETKEVEKNVKVENNMFDAHILLVEDNETNQFIMKVMLGNMGITYDIAFNGLEAVEKFQDMIYDKNTNYDVILMDENMPIMNGIEATKEILKLEKTHNLLHTPIIALTANAIKGDKERFLEAGMDEYLSKPINKNKFDKILSEFLPIN